jgi:hypothetical protein
MEILVNCRNPQRKLLITRLTPFILRELKIDHFDKPLYITVEKCGPDTHGGMQSTPFGNVVCLNTGMSLESLAQTLAHELVHLKQRLRGQLQGHSTWMGVCYDTKVCDYLSLPWEIEAFSRQDLLYRRAWAAFQKG